MIRKIIEIDQEKCNGCRLCVDACHEGAIGMVDGKAKLMRDDYCDGLGDCLPVCPTGAITFVEREADAYDEDAVQENMRKAKHAGGHGHHDGHHGHKEAKADLPCGCPGSMSKSLHRNTSEAAASHAPAATAATATATTLESQLRQWPVQIKLVPVNAPYFNGANLLVAADCSAFAYGNFHNDFMKNKVTIIGCPKLDDGDYSEKLTAILANNDIKSVTVVRMEVPCCGGIQHAVVKALQNSGKMIPWQIVTISADGEIIE